MKRLISGIFKVNSNIRVKIFDIRTRNLGQRSIHSILVEDEMQVGEAALQTLDRTTTRSYEKTSVLLDAKPALMSAANSFVSTSLEEPVKIRLGLSENPQYDIPPITVHEMFAKSLRRPGAGNLPALVCKRDGFERRWTLSEYYRECVKTAKSLIALGLSPKDTVGILGFNAPEWFFSMIGSQFAGCVPFGIYATNSAEACGEILQHARAKVVVVENSAQARKLARLPLAKLGVQFIVQYEYEHRKTGAGKALDEKTLQQLGVRLLSWKTFIRLGSLIEDQRVSRRISGQAPNHCANMVYTSGTTGHPKAVMLSHDNLTWVVNTNIKNCGFKFGQERVVSYLPLSHVAAQMVDLYLGIGGASCVHFARPDAMQGSLIDTLLAAQPTVLFGVPRVWEKLQERITRTINEMPRARRVVVQLATQLALSAGYKAMENKENPITKSGLGINMARGLVLSKLRNRLGLNETRYFITGAAPISKDTQEFFLSLNMPLLEAFGMSETTGPHTLSIPTEFTFSGSRVDGSSRTIIDEPDPTGEGELMIQGRDVFMGYMGNEADTRATFDRDFRMRTGDLARVDNGFLKITGRIKDIVVTAGGENISPVPIEERLKMAVPALVSNCIVVGDRRKYLISLAALRVDTDPVTNAPTDKIAADALAFMKKQCGLPEGIATVSELLASPKAESTRQALNELFKQALNKINREAVSHAARVQLVEILPRDFSLVGGELGPTMKLRRAFVLKLYAELIESIYEKHGINGPQR